MFRTLPRSYILLSFLVSFFLNCAAFAADELSPEKVFKWTVVNENRLLDSGDPSEFDPHKPLKQNQFRFMREFCRARYCGALKPEDIGTDEYCDEKPPACPKGRMKDVDKSSIWNWWSNEDDIHIWGALPQAFKTPWIEEEARYDSGYLTSRSRQLRTELYDAKDRECRWKLEPVDSELKVDIEFKKGSCTDQRFNVEVGIDYSLSLLIDSAIPGRSLAQPAIRKARVDDVLILALGDSYSSGEGNPHWPANYSSKSTASTYGEKNPLDQWWDRRCHRSLLSYPSLATAVAAVQSRGLTGPLKYSFTLASYACSGAEIRKSKVALEPPGRPYYSGGMLDKYEGRETLEQLKFFEKKFDITLAATKQAQLQGGLLPQVDQAKRDLCLKKSGEICTEYRHPNYIILTIGGNDVGFGPILVDLIDACHKKNNKDKCATDLIDNRFGKDLEPGLKDLATALVPLKDSNTKVLIMQYPDITSAKRGEQDKSGSNKDTKCDDENFERVLGPDSLKSMGYGVDIPLSFLGKSVSASEATWAYYSVLDRLNSVLTNFVNDHKNDGWELLGGIEKVSKGKGWCAKPSWFVTFEDSKAKQGVLPEKGRLNPAFTTGVAHPNVFGHNYVAWRFRCRLEKDGILPKGQQYSGGAGSCE